jgi:hypothetical protein
VILGVIGRGAHGVVLAGRHVDLGREVAIQQLAPLLAGDRAASSKSSSREMLLSDTAVNDRLTPTDCSPRAL